MSTEDFFRDTLGDKYTPQVNDYCLSNRRSAPAKKLEGWFSVGEVTNHGEVMVLLARKKPEQPKPAAGPKPTLGQRIASTFRGNK